MPQQIANIQKAHIFGFHHICILKSNKIDWFLQEAFNHHHLVHSSSGENNSSERVCHRSNLLSMFFSVSNQCLNLSPLALIPNWTPPEGSKISRHKRSCWFIIRREIADALTQWRLVNIALQTNGSSIKLLWNVNFPSHLTLQKNNLDYFWNLKSLTNVVIFADVFVPDCYLQSFLGKFVVFHVIIEVLYKL